MYHRIWSQTQVHQKCHRANLIRPTTANIKNKRRNKNKKHRKLKDQDSSYSSLSDSDLSDKSDYKSKRHDRKKKYCEKKQEPIKLCAELMAKFLTTAYKSKILNLKMDEYLLHS